MRADRRCEPEAEPHILGFLYWTINQIKTWELAEKRHIMAQLGNFFDYATRRFCSAPDQGRTAGLRRIKINGRDLGRFSTWEELKS
jgi:hypothetical protein